jgi:hypothetical protein
MAKQENMEAMNASPEAASLKVPKNQSKHIEYEYVTKQKSNLQHEDMVTIYQSLSKKRLNNNTIMLATIQMRITAASLCQEFKMYQKKCGSIQFFSVFKKTLIFFCSVCNIRSPLFSVFSSKFGTNDSKICKNITEWYDYFIS